ncbi:MAG: hypothetical protein GF313_12690, partial [Caldithrix sp.]|nr:hypothetical protein [Caldithrix sp.]
MDLSLKKLLKTWPLFLFITLIWTGQLQGQSFLIHHYTEGDGLGSSEVYDIEQDNQGQMWFATRSAVSVYDGFTWTNFNYSTELDFSIIAFLERDDEDRIWVCPQYIDQSLAYFQQQEWHYVDIANSHIKNSSEIIQFKTFRYNDSVSLAFLTQEFKLYIWTDGKWIFPAADPNLKDAHILDIASKDGSLYLASNRGIFKFGSNWLVPQFKQYNFKSDVQAIAFDNQTVWFGGKDWLGYLKDGKLNSYTFQAKNKKSRLICLEPDGFGNAYYANRHLIFRFDRFQEAVNPLTKRNGLLSEGANSIFRDIEGNIWIGNYRGISKLPATPIHSFNKNNGLFADEVTSIIQRANDEFVFGHEGGISIYNGSSIKQIPFEIRSRVLGSANRVLDMALDKKGDIWVAVPELGLGLLKPDNSIRFNRQFKNIIALLMLSEEQLLCVMQKKAVIYELKNDKIIHLNLTDDVSYRKAFWGQDSSVYLTTVNSGIIKFSNAQVDRFGADQHPLIKSTYAFYDGGRSKYVGTSSGLFILDGDSLKKCTKPFCLERPVYALFEDSRSNLYFGTNAGVYIWNGKILREIDIRHGLAGLEINRDAIIEDAEGHLWIGTNLGVSKLHMKSLRERYYAPPRLEFKPFTFKKQQFSMHKPIQLPYNLNDLTFRFQCISFFNEKQIRLRYKLIGFHDQWREVPKILKNSLHFSHLPPGDYQLLLQAKNVNSHWSKTVSTPLIHIKSPMWSKWWFMSGLLVILAILIYLIFSLTARRKY